MPLQGVALSQAGSNRAASERTRPTIMDFEKSFGAAQKTSISPSRALMNEAERQVENGQWSSKTAFFEAAAWLMVEMQSLGADMLVEEGLDDGEIPQETREIARSSARLELHVHEQPRENTDSDSETPHPHNDDDSTDT